MTLIDISVPISDTIPVYTDDAQVSITRAADFDRGDSMTLSNLALGAHTGTHLDAPRHFIRGGKTIEQLDLDTLIGPVRVVELAAVEREISAADLDAVKLPAGMQRILFKTRSNALWAKPGFQPDFVGVGRDAAQWLVEHGVRLVGIDYLSIEIFGRPDFPTHHILLGAGVIVLEGLDLRNVEPGDYQLICLPIKLQGVEGAPARAVLVRT